MDVGSSVVDVTALNYPHLTAEKEDLYKTQSRGGPYAIITKGKNSIKHVLRMSITKCGSAAPKNYVGPTIRPSSSSFSPSCNFSLYHGMAKIVNTETTVSFRTFSKHYSPNYLTKPSIIKIIRF